MCIRDRFGIEEHRQERRSDAKGECRTEKCEITHADTLAIDRRIPSQSTLCGHKPRTSGKIEVIADFGPTTRRDKHGRCRLALHVRMLAAEYAARLEQAERHFFDNTNRVEAVIARPERQRRIMVACFGFHALPRSERYVRRIRDDHVDAAVEVCKGIGNVCLLYTSPSPRDRTRSRM